MAGIVGLERSQVSVLIVDDHPVVRSGTRRMLEEGGLHVVGDVESAEEALDLLSSTAPDVMLLDVRLPGISGVELVQRLKEQESGVKVLMLSAHEEIRYVRAALQAGAVGYLVKTAPDEEIVSAVYAAAAGSTVLDASISVALLAEGQESNRTELSEREREVVGLVIEGLPNKTIAATLGVSTRTVDAHLSHLFAKADVSSRAELVAWAARHGMIEQ